MSEEVVKADGADPLPDEAHGSTTDPEGEHAAEQSDRFNDGSSDGPAEDEAGHGTIQEDDHSGGGGHGAGHKAGMGALALGALGIVYGDIGTSPLYAFREAFEEHH